MLHFIAPSKQAPRSLKIGPLILVIFSLLVLQTSKAAIADDISALQKQLTQLKQDYESAMMSLQGLVDNRVAQQIPNFTQPFEAQLVQLNAELDALIPTLAEQVTPAIKQKVQDIISDEINTHIQNSVDQSVNSAFLNEFQGTIDTEVLGQVRQIVQERIEPILQDVQAIQATLTPESASTVDITTPQRAQQARGRGRAPRATRTSGRVRTAPQGREDRTTSRARAQVQPTRSTTRSTERQTTSTDRTRRSRGS
ncbi:MAG: hypothetical protein H6679_00300 [Epsilonproteobacteria bacterium]|nr:hypothetical protein [Campylobacterota bacterium]